MTNEENGMTNQLPEKPKLLGIIMNPVEQFSKIRERPTIWIPLLVVTILTVLGSWMMASGMDYESQLQMAGADLTEMSDEDIAMTAQIMKTGSIVGGIFVPIISILISTVIYFIVAKITKNDVGFKRLFSLNTFVFFISVIGMLINGIAFLLTGNVQSEELFTSLNSVINAKGALGALFNSFEVFAIWNVILSAIGLQIVGRFSKGLAWGVVIAIFIITTSFSAIGAGLSSLVGA